MKDQDKITTAEMPKDFIDSVLGPIRPYDEEVQAFGGAWCGPERYSLWEKCLVARYNKRKASDGQSVSVYCTPAPARFYQAEVEPSPNSVGTPQPGYSISTGSGQAKLIALIAQSISEGMLGFDAAPALTETEAGQ